MKILKEQISREIKLKDINIHNFFKLKGRDFATDEEKKNYNFFNIGIKHYFEVNFYMEQCCFETVSDNWKYCPICGEPVRDIDKIIEASNMQEARKITKKKAEYNEKIESIVDHLSFNLMMS